MRHPRAPRYGSTMRLGLWIAACLAAAAVAAFALLNAPAAVPNSSARAAAPAPIPSTRATPRATGVDRDCGAPITFTIGTVDEQFGLSREEFSRQVRAAADEWNDATGIRRLVPAENGVLPVNLLFDGRQAHLLEISAEKDKLEARAEELHRMREQKAEDVRILAEEVRRGRDDMRPLVKAGIAADDELRAQQIALSAAFDALSARLSESAPYEAGEFVAGTNLRAIDIFAYVDIEDLHGRLLHEFGHALGLEHLPQSDAVMYAVRSASAGASQLTSADMEAALSLCTRR